MKILIHGLMLSVLMGLWGSAVADERTVSLSIPPPSLGQWYRPQNKRDVWLHTMFRLRREMQAVSEYMALQEPSLVRQWLDRLQKDYLGIGKMIPEWRDELETDLLEQMQQLAKDGQWEKLARKQRKLGKSCQSCHREYKLTAALIYRAPDFSSVRVESEETLDEEPYDVVMRRMSLLLNRLKIASEDQRWQAGLDAQEQLRQRLADLKHSCAACHKQQGAVERILGSGVNQLLQQISAGLQRQDSKQVGRYMGELAVAVCADCHAIHRMQSDVRKLLISED